MQAELRALEEQAGVGEQHDAFVEYNTDADLRRLYFSVLDKNLRKALIKQCRLFRARSMQFSQARLDDALNDLAALEGRGVPTPWVGPALLAVTAVWIGYWLWNLPGALAGAVAGFFIGNAHVAQKRNAWAADVALLRNGVEELRAEVKQDERYSERHPVFSGAEEESGGEDEGVAGTEYPLVRAS